MHICDCDDLQIPEAVQASVAGSALPNSRHYCQEFMPRHAHVSANIQFCFVVVRFLGVMEDGFWNWLICIF